MLKLILDLLKDSPGDTENIRIAQGKYKLTTGVRESFNQLKTEMLWQLKK
tara:strand:- start:1095 stop:1244 length:150 start_codon:yes stop_codon:yes gene_type:complete